VLSTVALPDSKLSCCGSEGTPEQILGGAAISRGRIFFASSDAVYAFGSKQATSPKGFAVNEAAEAGAGEPTYLQVSPTEMVLSPGQSVQLHARLFDAKGRFIREDNKAAWALQGLRGTMGADGRFTVAGDPVEQAGTIKATLGALSGETRAKVVHPLPWKEDFESYADGAVPPGWVNAVAGTVSVTTLDGQKVLQKAPTDTIFKRARVFIGPVTWSDYSFEADVRAATRRRQIGDVGITAQRYSLILYGNAQKLRLEPWEPETARTVNVPFSWKPDTWYRLKVRVENQANGQVHVLGKAWPRDETEPAAWLIDKTDPIGNRAGAPGLFLDAQFGVYLDNFSLAKN